MPSSSRRPSPTSPASPGPSGSRWPGARGDFACAPGGRGVASHDSAGRRPRPCRRGRRLHGERAMTRTVRLAVLSFILAAGGILPLLADSADAQSPRGDAKKGEALYAQKCAVCHGATGKGDGAAEFVLFPKPRDLTSGKFKIRP